MKTVNMNPKGLKVGDCVVRAISYATEKSWEEVYEGLFKIGLKMKRMLNDRKVYEKYLEEIGWVKHKQPRKDDGRKFTIEEFCDWQYEPNKVIVSIANHLTCIDDFELVDTWDCSYKCIGNYWTKYTRN